MRTPEELNAQALARQLRYRERLKANGGRIMTVALTAAAGEALDRIVIARGVSQMATINEAIIRLAELYPETDADR